MIDKTLFRKYDIRGVYPDSLNEDAAYEIGLAFANVHTEAATVAVGGDIRRSTPKLKEAVIKGLVDGGKKVIDAGICITPVVYFAVCNNSYDAGLMITGSHLDGTYNGIKIVLQNAEPTTPDDYERIMKNILEDRNKVSQQKGTVQEIDFEQDYMDYSLARVKLDKPLSLVIDSGNGTARDLPERIFKRLGCEVQTIYAEPDDSYPNHIADPYKHTNMQDLRKKVLETGADLGIAYDGDGDRAGFVTKQGYILTGDDLLMIYTQDAFARRLGPIAADSRASLALIEYVRSKGQEIHLTVGYHAAVLAKIHETNAVFGGETTCHFYFPLEFYTTDDAVFASLKLCQIASAKDDFDGYVNALPRYVTGEEIFIGFPDTEKYQAVDDFVRLAKEKGLAVNDVDGARIDYDNGWGIVRPSNTSPFIKAKFEGRTADDIKDVALKMSKLMSESGIQVPEEELAKIEAL